MKAYGYVRVSTDEQARSGLGLESQRDAVRKASKHDGHVVDSIFEDAGVSGSVPPLERPGFRALFEGVARGDRVYVAKRDRLGRDYIEVGLVERELRRRRVVVVSAAGEGGEGDDPSSALMRGVTDLFAEHERAMIRDRIKRALAAKRAKGEVLSNNPPFGTKIGKDGKRLIADIREVRCIQLVLRKRRSGFSMRQIVRDLARAGYRSRTGKRPLNVTQVWRIIQEHDNK